jgi:hypothetical protein
VDVSGGGRDPQLVYASWLERGTRAALLFLLGAFVAYVAGWPEPAVPLDRVAALWGEPARRYLELTGTAAGWAWLPLVGHADYLNLLGIALIGLVTPVCFLRIAALLVRRGERLQAALALAQAALLLVAASGVFAAGH